MPWSHYEGLWDALDHWRAMTGVLGQAMLTVVACTQPAIAVVLMLTEAYFGVAITLSKLGLLLWTINRCSVNGLTIHISSVNLYLKFRHTSGLYVRLVRLRSVINEIFGNHRPATIVTKSYRH